MTENALTRPNDLHLKYHWCEGSVPPPHYYEYTIAIGPGARGEMTLCPDYAMGDPPVWSESFAVSEGALDDLYQLMLQREAFRSDWASIQDPPVGGSLEWLEVRVEDEHFRIPAKIVEAESVEPVYAAIRALVPQPIWDTLMGLREQYEQEFSDD